MLHSLHITYKYPSRKRTPAISVFEDVIRFQQCEKVRPENTTWTCKIYLTALNTVYPTVSL